MKSGTFLAWLRQLRTFGPLGHSIDQTIQRRKSRKQQNLLGSMGLLLVHHCSIESIHVLFRRLHWRSGLLIIAKKTLSLSPRNEVVRRLSCQVRSRMFWSLCLFFVLLPTANLSQQPWLAARGKISARRFVIARRPLKTWQVVRNKTSSKRRIQTSTRNHR